MQPSILRTLTDLRATTRNWQRSSLSIGVVPTMGALHDGHLSLVDQARTTCDRVIATIFVNPKQFNNPDDLLKYPRTEDDDIDMLAARGVDAIYIPAPEQIYPDGFATNVSVSGLTDVMEGQHRPGHFDGVATVVAKLFLQTQADHAYFGEKDFQQLLIVKRMARDLDIPVQITGCPTIRESSGLAMSSRNRRLSETGRQTAATLNAVMRDTVSSLTQGAAFPVLAEKASETLTAQGFGTLEYYDLRCTETLARLDRPTPTARLFAAIWLEDVRLIDNIAAQCG